MNKGIYTRGYLPHWDFAEGLQAVTFRLADSMPAAVIRGWRKELVESPDAATRERELHRRIAHFEDAGHGACVLRRPEFAGIIQAKLLDGHPQRYRLLAWCVMPNHVHVLFKLAAESTLSGLLRAWKGASAVEINRLLDRSGHLWQREYYDRFIRDIDHLYDCRTYIRNNPVKAGLCEKPEDWLFSSAGCDWNPDAAHGAPASAGDGALASAGDGALASAGDGALASAGASQSDDASAEDEHAG